MFDKPSAIASSIFSVRCHSCRWLSTLQAEKCNREDVPQRVSLSQSTSPFLQDMYSIGQSPTPFDSSQDYHLVMATEEDGHTIFHFERAANTGNTKDIQFTVIVLASLAKFYEESKT